MKRREFIKRTAVSSLIGGISLDKFAHRKEVKAAIQQAGGEKPLVTIAASNEPELRNPVPLASVSSRIR